MSSPQTPGPDDAAQCPPAGPGTNPDIDGVDFYNTGEPHQHSTPAAVLPVLADVIALATHLGERMLETLRLQVNPTSEPTVLAWPATVSTMRVHDLLLAEAISGVKTALSRLKKISELPARQDPTPGPVATPDVPGPHENGPPRVT